MKKIQSRILAIDPGTRFVGIAVLSGEELLYYAVKTIRNYRTTQGMFRQGRDIIRNLIIAYEPDYVAIEKGFVFQKSAALVSVLANEMENEAIETGLRTFGYVPSAVRKYLCQSSFATKRDVARLVAQVYPEMSFHLNPLNKWEEKYYSHIFDAIAVGLMCQHEIDSKTAAAA